MYGNENTPNSIQKFANGVTKVWQILYKPYQSCPKSFKILPKWWNFGKYGHTATHLPTHWMLKRSQSASIQASPTFLHPSSQWRVLQTFLLFTHPILFCCCTQKVRSCSDYVLNIFQGNRFFNSAIHGIRMLLCFVVSGHSKQSNANAQWNLPCWDSNTGSLVSEATGLSTVPLFSWIV